MFQGFEHAIDGNSQTADFVSAAGFQASGNIAVGGNPPDAAVQTAEWRNHDAFQQEKYHRAKYHSCKDDGPQEIILADQAVTIKGSRHVGSQNQSRLAVDVVDSRIPPVGEIIEGMNISRSPAGQMRERLMKIGGEIGQVHALKSQFDTR